VQDWKRAPTKTTPVAPFFNEKQPIAGKYDKVRITFNGAQPFARLLTFTDKEWSQLTRMNKLKNWK
jgi:hypothetical protein